MQKFLKSSLLQ